MKLYYVVLLMVSFVFANSYSDSGNWKLERHVDELDESVTELLTAKSEKPIKGWVRTGNIEMVIDCDGRRFVFFSSLRFESNFDDIQVIRLKFDDEPVEKIEMYVSETGKGLSFSPLDNKRMIKKIATIKKLKIGVEMFGTDIEQVAHFDVSGFNEVKSQCSNK